MKLTFILIVKIEVQCIPYRSEEWGHSSPRNIIQGSNGNAIYLKEWKNDNFNEIFCENEETTGRTLLQNAKRKRRWIELYHEHQKCFFKVNHSSLISRRGLDKTNQLMRAPDLHRRHSLLEQNVMVHSIRNENWNLQWVNSTESRAALKRSLALRFSGLSGNTYKLRDLVRFASVHFSES